MPNEHKAIIAATRRAKIEKILDDFKGLRRIAGIESGGKRHKLHSMKTKDGQLVTDKKEIANAMASFYDHLYDGDKFGRDVFRQQMHTRPIIPGEAGRELKDLKSGKASEAGLVVAEFLKWVGDDMITMIAEMLTSILDGSKSVREYWRASVIRVLHKKGSQDDPENYRPICLMPILYKVFSKILLRRM